MGGLSLLAPKALWLLGLLAPLVALYVLKVRRERVRVGSTWLWAAAQRDLLAQSPFRRLRPYLSLLLQALALALLALALARPTTLGGGAAHARVALVVDVSASMGAPGSADDPGSTALDRARSLALELVRGLPPGSEAMVVEAGRRARVTAPLDRDRRRVEGALASLAVLEVEGELEGAIALGVERLRGLEGARVVVLTDAHLARPTALASSAVPIEVVEVGANHDNAAIVRVDARLATDPATGQDEAQVFALVANLADAPRELYVTLRLEGADAPIDARRVLVAPKERAPVALGFQPEPGDGGRGFVLELAPSDALAVDDRAFGRVPEGGKQPVVLVSTREGSPWLGRALEADPGVSLERATLADLADPSRARPGTLVVVEGACPEPTGGGDWIVFDPPEGTCLGVEVRPSTERPAITSWATGDPRLRFLTLDGLTIAKARGLVPKSPAQALVKTAEAAIVVDASDDRRGATVVGFDVGETDWPLRASFVLFMRNLVEVARVHRASGAAPPAIAGEPLRVPVPRAWTKAAHVAPDGAREELPVQSGFVVLPSLHRVGLHRVEPVDPTGGPALVVPVSLASEAESALTSRATLSLGAQAAPRSEGELPPQRREWGWLAALLALGLVVLEVFTSTRQPRFVPTREGAPSPRRSAS